VANVVVAVAAEHNDDERMPKKSAASRLTAEGASASWTQQKKGVQDLYETFAECSDEVKEKLPANLCDVTAEQAASKDLYGLWCAWLCDDYIIPAANLCDVTAEQAASKDLYGLWCAWLCDDYIIPAGKSKANQHLGCGSVNDSLNLLLKLACGRFRLRSGSLQTDLSLIVQSNPPAVVSAQAPRSFVIYNSQFPLASSRFGRDFISVNIEVGNIDRSAKPKQASSYFSGRN
jgi:hypothetical protein